MRWLQPEAIDSTEDSKMSSDKFIEIPAAVTARPPVTVWIITLLIGVMAFVSVVGSFLFSFPRGDLLGYIAGTLLVVAGIGYATILLRLRRGERAVWTATLVLPIVHMLGLNTADLMLYGAIPREDYPFMGVVLAIVVLLLLPATRRFFVK